MVHMIEMKLIEKKEDMKEYNKRYYQLHREEILEKQRRQRREHELRR
jgi:hypothetical protein